jgi:hypothetical protein
MYWFVDERHASRGFGRLIKDFGNDKETFFVLNKSKIRMLRPPKLGGCLVIIQEKVGPSGLSRHPCHGTLSHDGTMTPALCIPCRAVILDTFESRWTISPLLIGRHIWFVGHDTLENPWFFGAVKVASMASPAFDQSMNVEIIKICQL